MQQEVAEELERERKRNQKELSTLSHTNSTLLRQRDDTQRVVLHLRSLINGQTHHMEHVLRNVHNGSELSELVKKGSEGVPEDIEESSEDDTTSDTSDKEKKSSESSRDGASSRTSASTTTAADPKTDVEIPTNNTKAEKQTSRTAHKQKQKRASGLSMDVADRNLRDKTDAIADIIRNISEQCETAIAGLHLAQDTDDTEGADEAGQDQAQKPESENNKLSTPNNEHNENESDQSSRTDGSDIGDAETENDSRLLTPDGRTSSVPPTPDLVHNRSSTSMSMMSNSTVQERSSQQYSPGDIPTKIVEHDDEHAQEAAHEQESESESAAGATDPTMTKGQTEGVVTPGATRIVS